MTTLQRDLKVISRAVTGVSLLSSPRRSRSVLDAQTRYGRPTAELAALDTSSIEGLLQRQRDIDEGLADIRTKRDEENKAIGANEGELGRHKRALENAERKLPGLDVDKTNALVWASRCQSPASGSLSTSWSSRRSRSQRSEVRLDSLKARADTIAGNLGAS